MTIHIDTVGTTDTNTDNVIDVNGVGATYTAVANTSDDGTAGTVQ